MKIICSGERSKHWLCRLEIHKWRPVPQHPRKEYCTRFGCDKIRIEYKKSDVHKIDVTCLEDKERHYINPLTGEDVE